MTRSDSLQKTPLNQLHRELGARLVPFAGWEMPVQYSGVIDEHRAVRTAAGLFDVSHMGELEVSGSGALEALQRLTPNDVARLEDGQAHYSALLTERGTVIDDLLVYRNGSDRFMLVVNAANRQRDLEWIRAHAGAGVDVQDRSDAIALLALQGPRAAEILTPLVQGGDPQALGPFRFARFTVAGAEVLISRTGYTGEDGFELYLDTSQAVNVFGALLDGGRDAGLRPVGLGARDTLRLEAALCLCGQDIDETTTPLEAGLGFIVKLDKGEFIGRDVLLRQKQVGPSRRLTGFRMVGRGVARQGYTARLQEGGSSVVTSGSHAPTLGYPIGLTYLPAGAREPGRKLIITIRERPVDAEVVPIPFYRRRRED